jgi:hypothetical protein
VRARVPKAAFAYVDSKGRRRLSTHDEPHVRNALGPLQPGQVRERDGARARAKATAHWDEAPRHRTGRLHHRPARDRTAGGGVTGASRERVAHLRLLRSRSSAGHFHRPHQDLHSKPTRGGSGGRYREPRPRSVFDRYHLRESGRLAGGCQAAHPVRGATPNGNISGYSQGAGTRPAPWQLPVRYGGVDGT